MILGIDAARNNTGWALLTGDEELVATGVVVIDHKDGDIRRAFQMVRDELVDIAQVADGANADVLGVWVEAPFMGPSPKVTVAHALWCGSVLAMAGHMYQHALIELIEPRRWRQVLGITGKGKGPVAEWAAAKWPEIATRTEHEIDAAAIACAARRGVEVVA